MFNLLSPVGQNSDALNVLGPQLCAGTWDGESIAEEFNGRRNRRETGGGGEGSGGKEPAFLQIDTKEISEYLTFSPPHLPQHSA